MKASIVALAPAPTQGPSDAELRRALNIRDDVATCGWNSAHQDEPFTCSAGYSCAYNTAYSAWGCCSGDLNTCSLQTNCYAATFNSKYTQNEYTRLCSAPAGSCQEYIMPNGYVSYGCGTSVEQNWLRTTYLGGSITAGGIFFGPSGTQYSTNGQAVGATPTGTAGGGGIGSAAASPGGTAGAQSSSGTSINNSNTNSNSVNVPGTSLSTGAIIGIAVAGGALVLVAIFGFILRMRRNKRLNAYSEKPQHAGYSPGAGGAAEMPSPYPIIPGSYFSDISPMHPGNGGPSGSPPSSTLTGSYFNDISPVHPGNGGPSRSPPSSTLTGSYINDDSPRYARNRRQPGPALSMTHSNMESHLQAQRAGEYDFVGSRVPQQETAARPNQDGIRSTEISPQDAVDEPPPSYRFGPESELGQTAVAPTALTHHVQAV